MQFMYDNLVVNTAQLRAGGEDAEGNGCILAHCMGLGKTVQVSCGVPCPWPSSASSHHYTVYHVL